VITKADSGHQIKMTTAAKMMYSDENQLNKELIVKVGKVKSLTSQGGAHKPELNPVSVA